MLRLETETGWWLVTHPDHARLAGSFAERWGNERFLPPEPRAHVLKGIARHDDGWAARDRAPQITRQGKPSAFSVELVGKYSAFEEIDLADYLAVRDRAVRLIAAEDAYAARAHLDAHLQPADRSRRPLDHRAGAIAAARPVSRAAEDISAIAAASRLPATPRFTPPSKPAKPQFSTTSVCCRRPTIFRLLTCVDFRQPAHLLHPLPLRDGGQSRVEVRRAGPRHFVLDPYPFAEPALSFRFPARHVEGKAFSSAADLQRQFDAAPVEMLSVTVSAAP